MEGKAAFPEEAADLGRRAGPAFTLCPDSGDLRRRSLAHLSAQGQLGAAGVG